MISVIVPIYNVEPYLRQCIDSVLAQIYTDLEILLVDDGSTDGSGTIADSYSDPRIRVYHTTNRGLSAARNLGIEKSTGDYLFFIDSDDWIEPDAISTALSSIDTADILCFSSQPAIYTGHDAMIAVLNNQISTAAWEKMYKKKCFSSIRFPEGRICEDTATIYKVFRESSQVKCINYCGYHYRYRSDSLSHTHDKKNILDFWFAQSDRYVDCKEIMDEETRAKLLEHCAFAITRAWAWRNSVPGLKEETVIYNEMQEFAKTLLPRYIRKNFPFHLRIGLIFARYNNTFSFWLANKLLRFYRLIKHLDP